MLPRRLINFSSAEAKFWSLPSTPYPPPPGVEITILSPRPNLTVALPPVRFRKSAAVQGPINERDKRIVELKRTEIYDARRRFGCSLFPVSVCFARLFDPPVIPRRTSSSPVHPIRMEDSSFGKNGALNRFKEFNLLEDEKF